MFTHPICQHLYIMLIKSIFSRFDPYYVMRTYMDKNIHLRYGNICFGRLTLILHRSSAEDWAHCEATRLRGCFSHLHRLTYKSQLSRSGGWDWTLVSLKPWPTALAGMELWGSWRSSMSKFAPPSEPQSWIYNNHLLSPSVAYIVKNRLDMGQQNQNSRAKGANGDQIVPTDENEDLESANF